MNYPSLKFVYIHLYGEDSYNTLCIDERKDENGHQVLNLLQDFLENTKDMGSDDEVEANDEGVRTNGNFGNFKEDEEHIFRSDSNDEEENDTEFSFLQSLNFGNKKEEKSISEIISQSVLKSGKIEITEETVERI